MTDVPSDQAQNIRAHSQGKWVLLKVLYGGQTAPELFPWDQESVFMISPEVVPGGG